MEKILRKKGIYDNDLGKNKFEKYNNIESRLKSYIFVGVNWG